MSSLSIPDLQQICGWLRWNISGLQQSPHERVHCTFLYCQESPFTVKVESVSPGRHTLHMGEDQDTSPSKLSKEELIQSMDRVDREIAKVEQQILKLKKKQVCP